MLSVEEARARILSAFRPVAAEQVSVAEAFGRVLAEDVSARVTQPPAAVSAMDGYAVRAADVAKPPVRLRTVGEAPAGGAFEGTVGRGQAVRIFTGGPLPKGTDAVVIQEDTEADGEWVTVRVAVPTGHYIRPAGLDFREGDVCLKAGLVLTARAVGLAAAMNIPWLSVRRKPRVAILATGDEIVMPGEPLGPSHIVSSNALALAALVDSSGGLAVNLGIARDNEASLTTMAAGAQGADILIITGGASVGEHDLVQRALGSQGLELDFWRIAMRPGKPLMFGWLKETPVLGLPGNPVSSLVCGLVFLRPVLEAMLGVVARTRPPATALLGRDLGANDNCQDYLRATLSYDGAGNAIAAPFEKQDSSMLSGLVAADCLVIRPPFAPPAKAGDRVTIIPL